MSVSEAAQRHKGRRDTDDDAIRCSSRLHRDLLPLAHLPWPRFIVVELVCFDAHADDLVLVDVHSF